MPTTAVGTSQIGRGASSTQISEGNQDINNNPPPQPSLYVNQSEADLDQIEVRDWDAVEEDEVEAEENELIGVQQEINRL
jgi:hypothetical protein